MDGRVETERFNESRATRRNQADKTPRQTRQPSLTVPWASGPVLRTESQAMPASVRVLRLPGSAFALAAFAQTGR